MSGFGAWAAGGDVGAAGLVCGCCCCAAASEVTIIVAASKNIRFTIASFSASLGSLIPDPGTRNPDPGPRITVRDSEKLLQERDDLLTSFRRFLMLNIVAEELPPLGVARLCVHLLELFVDDVEPLDGRQLIAKSSQSQVRARCDERVDLRRCEVLDQAGHEVVHAVKRQRLSRE